MSSTRVTVIIHPRTDFPQFGWIGKPQTGSNLFEQSSGWQVPPIQEISSFRMADRLPSSSQNKVLYEDFASPGQWLAPANALADAYVASFGEINSFRTDPQQPNNALKNLLLIDWTEPGWIAKAKVTFYEQGSGIEVPGSYELNVYRMPDRLPSKSQNSVLNPDFGDFAWVSQPNNLDFNANSGWEVGGFQQLSSFLMPSQPPSTAFRILFYNTFNQSAEFLAKANEDVWVDPYLETASYIMPKQLISDAQSRLFLTDWGEPGWIAKQNKTLYEPGSGFNVPATQLLSSFIMPMAQQDKTFIRQDQPESAMFLVGYSAYYATLVPSQYEGQSYRMPDAIKDKTLILQDQPEQGYLFTQDNLIFGRQAPAFYSDQSYRMRDALKDIFFIRQDQPSAAWNYGFVGPQIASWTAELYEGNQSFRMSDAIKDKTYMQQEQPELGWLFTVVGPQIQTFSASLYGDQSYRMRDALKDKVFMTQEQFDYDWLSAVLSLNFNPQLYAPASSESQSFRMPDVNKSSMPDYYNEWPRELAVYQHFNPTFWPENEQLTKSFMMDNHQGTKWGYENTLNTDWIFTDIKPFDPSKQYLDYESQSYSMPLQKPSAGERRLLYTDFPEQGWIAKAKVTLFEPGSGWDVPAVAEMACYRTPAGIANLQRDYDSVPNFGWLFNPPVVSKNSDYIVSYRRRRR